MTHFAAIGDDCIGKWIALKLADGSSDMELYDTKETAVRHQTYENQCAYMKITPDGTTPRLAETFLKFCEDLYDNGWKLSDPDRQIPLPMHPENVPGILSTVRKG